VNNEETVTPESVTFIELFHRHLDNEAAIRRMGTNSPKLCAKRRRQMFKGKLGSAARQLAYKEVQMLWNEFGPFDDMSTACDKLSECIKLYIQGKDPKQNA